jgi:membrane protein required for colicin V production
LIWIDAVIAALMVLGFIHGLLKGAIQEVFAVLALIGGVIVAGRVSAGTVSITSQLSHPEAGKVFVFVITFFITALIIGFIGKLFTGMAKAANLRILDRIIGGIVGACLVGLAVGILFKVGETFGMDISFLDDSPLAQQLILAVTYLSRFLPAAKDTIGT